MTTIIRSVPMFNPLSAKLEVLVLDDASVLETSPNISTWYKLHGYGLCKEKPSPKIAGYEVQDTPSIFGKLLVILSESLDQTNCWEVFVVLVDMKLSNRKKTFINL